MPRSGLTSGPLRSVSYLTTCAAVLLLVLPAARASAQGTAPEIEKVARMYHDARLFNGSILVAKGDDVLYQNGFGDANMEWDIPNTPDARFRIGSVTKQFTAAIILQLVEDGKMDLQDVVTDYLPEYPGEQGDRVTIHHLLTHTSGIPSFTSFPSYEEFKRDPFSTDSILTLFSGLDLMFEPGTQWSYNNSGYFLLGALIEQVTGKTYDEIVQERLLDPLGLENTGYDHVSDIIEMRASGYVRTPSGYANAPYLDTSVPFAAGMLYSTVGDLLTWTRALHGGMVFESDTTYERMIEPFLQDYAYGIAVRSVAAGPQTIRLIGHSGGIDGFTSQLWYAPDDEYTIAVLDNTMSDVSVLADAVLNVLYGVDAPEPTRPIVDVLGPIVEKDGVEEAVERYRTLKSAEPEAYDFSESQLNGLGYFYLERGETETAIRIFQLNVEVFPEASNPYDSLGEAYLKSGNRKLAIENYTRALELDPGSQSARAALRTLGSEPPDVQVKVSADVLKTYVGKYELQPGFVLDVTLQDERLFVQATGQARYEVFPSGENEFYYKVVDAQLTFVKSEDGAVDTVILHQNGREAPARRIE